MWRRQSSGEHMEARGVQRGPPESPQEEAMTKLRHANQEELGDSGHRPPEG